MKGRISIRVMSRFFIVILLVGMLLPRCSYGQGEPGGRVQQPVQNLPIGEIENGQWRIIYGEKGLIQIINKDDTLSNYLPASDLGDVLVKYKIENGMWQSLSQRKRRVSYDEGCGVITLSDTATGKTLVMRQSFSLSGDGIRWDIELKNLSKYPILLGDVAPAIPRLDTYTPPRDEDEPWSVDVYKKNFTKHHFIQGDLSFIYFTRFGGEFPAYIWTALPGTSLEYWATVADSQRGAGGMGSMGSMGGGFFDRKFRVYAHSGESARESQEGSWRQEQTYATLAPAGESGDELHLALIFESASSYDELRARLYENNSIDTRIFPSMTLPRGVNGMFSLHTKCKIDSLVAEFPESTSIEFLKRDGRDTYIYKVNFERLGENRITIYFDGDRKTYLEYFATLTPEELLKKRAKFLVEKQQVRDSSKWYDGLYGVYDMKSGELRTPDNPDIYDKMLTYFLASDDPILGKAPFIASKNEVFPDDEEIASLEYYLENFVWGGLQRRDDETPYPYAIYGTPNWLINRDEELKATQTDFMPGVLRAWRSFDYPHMVMLYYHLYHIAKLYPEKCSYLDADGYLERAFQTAMAYYLYPSELHGDYYETFKWGCYNELVILGLIEDLEREGREDDADSLRRFWERKAKYFIYDAEYPYHSEYEVDRTAYESAYALAQYGVQNEMESDDKLWYDPNLEIWYSHPDVTREAARDFMERQFYANLSSRGVLENEWNTLGADFVYSSEGSEDSYMARMGGWGVLNYALRYAENPNEWLATGYASYMDPFGLMNAGDEESDYGYWYPGEERDGAIGQAYTPSKMGRAWIGTEEQRGPWRYCGEGDLGMCAVTRTATIIVTEDPIFGWVCYGGEMEHEGKKGYTITPYDGVRQDLWILDGASRLHLKINRDNWSATNPIHLDLSKRSLRIEIESGVEAEHETELLIESLNCTPELSDSTPHGKAHSSASETSSASVSGEADVTGGANEVNSAQLQKVTERSDGWHIQRYTIPIATPATTIELTW